MTVVVVSNRVARVKPGEPMTGGLASALLPIVENAGAIWVGSSDRPREGSRKDSFAEIEALGSGALATVDLPAEHYRGFYEGFANSALWPALHSRTDLIRVAESDYKSYVAINAFMARALLRFSRPDVSYWVQDYHFLTLGAELRQLGIRQPIGFFLHTPWAERSSILGVPHHREIVLAMLAYDLIGFQTDDDKKNFEDYVKHELKLGVVNGVVTSMHGRSRLATFPIGIDADDFARRAIKASAAPEVSRLKESLQNGKLVFGVDRLDYSKGISNRILAFDRLLQDRPEFKRQVALLQIAVPSRGQINAYRQLKNEILTLVGDVNGRHSDVDWTPIRYLNKAFSQARLAGFYRAAHVGLVTPLHDGMNLVAKEYVAAQDPADPGVLVLSEFAGAAKELDTALLVNPHDIEALSQAIATAITMPLDERRERWRAMMEKVRSSSGQTWFADFVAMLTKVRPLAATRLAPSRLALLPKPMEQSGLGFARTR
jgi:trehalose 6-phosphate synthase